ncbi:hypothetical protein T12_16848 [Trichinella patagoniensis]|uniref:Uncharacterized protein n=1 Tax=Trichinella patagoniensis TaxID=990121 RepID=A0A0V0YZJ7_9BILA|nr:hypothetical protein T12_16848 [Trichinella patagoniensis]
MFFLVTQVHAPVIRLQLLSVITNMAVIWYITIFNYEF